MCIKTITLETTQFMEDETGEAATKASFAGGNSGLSFGSLQLDVASNTDAKNTFEQLMVDSGLFTNQEVDIIASSAATEGVNDSDFDWNTSQGVIAEDAINQALSTPDAITAIEQAELVYFEDTLNPHRESVIAAAGNNPNGLGVFDPEHPDFTEAQVIITAWINRSCAT